MAVVTVILASGTSWAIPHDWSNDGATIGGCGAGGKQTGSGLGAGGAGAWAEIEEGGTLPDLEAHIGEDLTFQLGASAGGPGSTGDTIVYDPADGVTPILLARAGSNTTSNTGGVGGDTALSVGDTKHSGGNGGNGITATAAGGGGGTAGRNGNGGNGESPSSGTGAGGGANGGGPGSSYTGGVGLDGGGSGGDGNAVSANNPGGNGTTYTDSVTLETAGPGGGASGGGAGGAYGGGSAAGTPGAGFLVIQYTPRIAFSSGNFFAAAR